MEAGARARRQRLRGSKPEPGAFHQAEKAAEVRSIAPRHLRIDGVLEVSIGHALISDALRYGLHETVRKYLACLPATAAN